MKFTQSRFRVDKFSHLYRNFIPVPKSWLLSQLSYLLALLCLTFPIFAKNLQFIRSYNDYEGLFYNDKVVLIASIGRSGSTMLGQALHKSLPTKYVVRTHCLPPPAQFFKGKIIYIFSNPNQSIESVFSRKYRWLFGGHFRNIQTSDISLLREHFSNLSNYTETNNLFTHDYLGYFSHLNCWICQLKPSTKTKAQVLAVRYENLWDATTLKSIQEFLQAPNFYLPIKHDRLHRNNLSITEKNIINKWNKGTELNPRYAAYDKATKIWEQTPPISYLELIPSKDQSYN